MKQLFVLTCHCNLEISDLFKAVSKYNLHNWFTEDRIPVDE